LRLGPKLTESFASTETVTGDQWKLEDVFVLPIDYNRRKIPVMVKNAENVNTTEHALDDEGKPAFREVPIGGWAEQVKFWGEMLLKTGARLIVVDTLISFSQLQNGESYDAGEITNLLTILKALYSIVPGLAIVVLCHCRKLSGTKPARSFADIAGSYAIRAGSDMNILLFAKDRKLYPRERTYVTEGRFNEHITDADGLTVEQSEDGSTFKYVTMPIWKAPDPKVILRDAVIAEPSLLKLGRDALADRFKDVGVTPAIARAVKDACKGPSGAGDGETQH